MRFRLHGRDFRHRDVPLVRDATASTPATHRARPPAWLATNTRCAHVGATVVQVASPTRVVPTYENVPLSYRILLICTDEDVVGQRDEFVALRAHSHFPRRPDVVWRTTTGAPRRRRQASMSRGWNDSCPRAEQGEAQTGAGSRPESGPVASCPTAPRPRLGSSAEVALVARHKDQATSPGEHARKPRIAAPQQFVRGPRSPRCCRRRTP